MGDPIGLTKLLRLYSEPDKNLGRDHLPSAN